MTPPDSGDHKQWCALFGDPVYTRCNCKPDSGEREVCGAVIARMNGDDALTCDQQRGHDGAHYVKIGAFGGAREDEVLLSLPLAQRILAALEEAHGFVPMAGKELQALAAELRARIPR